MRDYGRKSSAGFALAVIGCMLIIIGMFLNIWKFSVDNGTSIGVNILVDWPESFVGKSGFYALYNVEFIGFWGTAFDVLLTLVFILTIVNVLTSIFSKKAENVVGVFNLVTFICLVLALICGILFCTKNYVPSVHLNISQSLRITWSVGAYIMFFGGVMATCGSVLFTKN